MNGVAEGGATTKMEFCFIVLKSEENYFGLWVQNEKQTINIAKTQNSCLFSAYYVKNFQ